ncbi:MAG TPA: DUF2461 domain-containing protein [Chitinophagaceae bacterium]|nr:DUF2461 domain-containing protein [Chitinophagaceae bacterium]
MLQASTLTFLRTLKRNNNKTWFDEHRSQYEQARADFGAFIQRVIDRQGRSDPAIAHLQAKDCLFRINRDVRFSKDKSPYKTNFGASIRSGGKKSILAGYYFHLEPGQSFAGGGIWQPLPAELTKIRQEIDYNLPEFRNIVESRRFRAVFGELYQGEGVRLSRLPKGYQEDNPAAPYLKFKSYLALADLSDKELTSSALEKKTLAALQALQPLVAFINRALEA